MPAFYTQIRLAHYHFVIPAKAGTQPMTMEHFGLMIAVERPSLASAGDLLELR
ncbi:MAG: hypothetical protein HYV16_04010 [Gammaproteobacteria bacterium]|nr:hypothetical protein [Gammaproteobacteria bacterium]